MPFEPNVSIILVNWNGKQDTIDCLASLYQDSYPNKTIVLVDNGSSDGTVAAVHQTFPDVVILETGRNLGFSGGNNAGIKRALETGADYIFLLNNDTTVEPDAVRTLVEAAEAHPEFGFLTPVIHYHDSPGSVWFGGSSLDLENGLALHENTPVPQRSDKISSLPWASGCALLARANLMERLGGFDERYYLMWEDVDLSLRAIGFGYGIALVPTARIYHKVSRSLAKQSMLAMYYYVRNNMLFARVHGNSARGSLIAAIAKRCLRERLRAIKNGESNAFMLLYATLYAIVHYSTGQYGAYQGRARL